MRVNRTALGKLLVVLGWTGVFVVIFQATSSRQGGTTAIVEEQKPGDLVQRLAAQSDVAARDVPAEKRAKKEPQADSVQNDGDVEPAKAEKQEEAGGDGGAVPDKVGLVMGGVEFPVVGRGVAEDAHAHGESRDSAVDHGVDTIANPMHERQKDKPERAAHDHDHALHTRAFDPSSPKLVLLLAYQRVGSTFIGEMFNKHPGVAYTYEPLDATYMHMYGTKEGWAVPMDLHFHWNGTYRPVPEAEQQIVAEHIEQVLTCDYDHVITEFLIHRFWQGFAKTQSAFTPYIQCIKAKSKVVSLSHIQQSLQKTCSARVGQNLANQAKCFDQLIHEATQAEFIKYQTALDAARDVIAAECLPKLQAICDSKPVHAIKTVRLDMETIERLVDRYPNLRIIHLIRDPRPVVLSRMKAGWATLGSTDAKKSRDLIKNLPAPKKTKAKPVKVISRNLLSIIETNRTSSEEVALEMEQIEKDIELAEKPPNDFAKEAALYCGLVLRDMHTRLRIEAKRPGTTYQMIYEHMVYHPTHEVARVYEFLNETMPQAVQSWAASTQLGAKKSRDIAEKWQDQMTVKTAKQIDQFCEELYEEIEFAWPDSE